MRYAKKILVMLMALIMLSTLCLVPVGAASDAHYYKGHDIIYGTAPYVGSFTWKTGWWLWEESHAENYYLSNSYYRCLTYYHDSWIANQGQTLSLTMGKTVNRTVTNTVQTEIGVSDVVSAGITAGYSDSISTGYSTFLGLTYDLSKCSRNSVRIASMGYIDRFVTMHYVSNTYKESYYRYAYDTNFGQEISLVYRW